YEHHLPTLHFLAGMGAPLPRPFEMAAEFLFNTDLRWNLKDELPDLEHIRTLFKEAEALHVRLDKAGLSYRLRKTLARMADHRRTGPRDLRAKTRTTGNVPPPVQPSLHLRQRARTGRLPARAGHQRPVHLAGADGPPRQLARLRHLRPHPAQPGAGRAGKLRC